jgi:carbonic anhydrase/acetyltransferase-like protein (isoleucine patch superfamily)
MDLKYRLLIDTRLKHGEKTLYCIQALRDFGDVKAGDIGGAIEAEHNLSHAGDCWVYHNGKVYGQAQVIGNAKVKDNAEVYDLSVISDDAVIAGNSKVFQQAMIYDRAKVNGQVSIYGSAQVFGDSHVIGFSCVHENAWVYGKVLVDGYSNITRKTTMQPIVISGIGGNVTVMDHDVSIGCQTKSFDEWRNVTREEAFVMNGKAGLKFFNESSDTIDFIVKKYRKHNGSNV